MSYKVGHEANWQDTFKEPKIIGVAMKDCKEDMKDDGILAKTIL